MLAIVRDKRWRPIEPKMENDSIISAQMDFWSEVVEPNGMVVASGRIDRMPSAGDFNAPPLYRYIAGTDVTFRIEGTQDSTELVAYRPSLVVKPRASGVK